MTCPPDEANPGPQPDLAPDAAPAPSVDEPVRAAILQHCTAGGPGKSADVSAIAQALGGKPADVVPWRALIRRIRAEAAAMQDQGLIVVLRKGKPVNIRAAKGVIRLALAAGDGRP